MIKRIVLVALALTGICHAQLPIVASSVQSTFVPATEPTPTMGWNPWQVWGANTTQAEIEANCLAMTTDGMLAAGYNYCGFDDVWATSRTNGGITPTSAYPTISTLCPYIHGLGEQCTGYLGPGTGCNGQISSSGYEAADVALLASWGVDYLKADTCSSWTTINAINTYAAYRAAVAAAGRPMRFFVSIPPGFCSPSSCAYPWTWFALVGGNEVWSENDVADDVGCGSFAFPLSWAELITAIESQYGIASYGGPNHYLFPGIYLGVGNGCLTDAQGVSDMSLMAVLAAPLFASLDLTASPSANTMATLTNKQVIAVDQDTLGAVGSRISQTSCGSAECEVYAKQLSGANKWAVVLWNQDSSSHSITSTFSAFGGSGTYTNTYNLWGNWPSCGGSTSCSTSLGSQTTSYSATVPAYSVVMFTLAP